MILAATQHIALHEHDAHRDAEYSDALFDVRDLDRSGLFQRLLPAVRAAMRRREISRDELRELLALAGELAHNADLERAARELGSRPRMVSAGFGIVWMLALCELLAATQLRPRYGRRETRARRGPTRPPPRRAPRAPRAPARALPRAV